MEKIFILLLMFVPMLLLRMQTDFALRYIMDVRKQDFSIARKIRTTDSGKSHLTEILKEKLKEKCSMSSFTSIKAHIELRQQEAGLEELCSCIRRNKHQQ